MTIVASKPAVTLSQREEMIFDVAQIIEEAATAEREIAPYELAEQIVDAMEGHDD